MLQGIHSAAALGLRMPELVLSEKDCTELAKAMLKAQEYYPVTINPKYAALASLVSVCAFIYGPRAIAIYQRVEAMKPRTSGATPSAQSNVIHGDFPQAPSRPVSVSPGVDIGPVAAAPAGMSPGRGGTVPLPDFMAPIDNGD